MSAPNLQYPPASGGGTPVGGSGSPGTIPVWSTGTTLSDSPLVTSGTNAVGFGTPKTWGTNFTTQAMQLSESSSLSADINTTYLSANWYLDSTYTARRIKANFAGQYRINGATGDHSWLTGASGAADSALTLTTAMTLTNAGALQLLDGTTSAPSLAFIGSTGTGMSRGSSGTILRFSSSGSFAFGVSSTGNVLIGGTASSTPGAILQTTGTATASVPAAASGATYNGVFAAGDAAGSYGTVMGVLSTGTGWIQAQQRTGVATTYPLLLNPNGGNVGIGTASPGANLHVLGTNQVGIFAGTSATAYIQFRYSSTTVGGYFGNGNGVLGGAASSDLIMRSEGALVFASNGNNRAVTIDASQNVGIGTASPASLGANYTTLDIRGSSGGGIRMGTPSIMSYMYADSSGYNLATATALPIIAYTNNVERMRINSAGAQADSQVAIGTSSFATFTGGAVAGITTVRDASINTVRVGLGGGVQPSNMAVGSGALALNTSGLANTAIGQNALAAVTTGGSNTAVGAAALPATTGSSNTGVGNGALTNLTSGSNNTALGWQAGWGNTTQGGNVAVGSNAALYFNAASNTTLGAEAMRGVSGSSTGAQNVVVGYQAAYSLTTGTQNVAVGANASLQSTTSTANVVVGMEANYWNTTGSNVVAIGYSAHRGQSGLTTAIGNVAVGSTAMQLVTTGASNVAVGNAALTAATSASNNTAVGYQAGTAITTGNSNVCVGWGAGNTLTTGSQNICIGVGATTAAVNNSNTLVIGSSGNWVATQGAATTYYNTATALSTGTLPATCGFIRVYLNGSWVKIPVYAD